MNMDGDETNNTIFRELLNAIKERDALIGDLHRTVVDLTARQDRTEESYLKLVAILEKSIVKIDQSALGLN